MLGLILTLAFLSASLGDDIQVTPKADLLQPNENTHVGQQPVAEKAEMLHEKGSHAFNQLTTGSTPSGWMQLGTPPKWLKVIFDTGSDKLVAKTWETISQELNQVDQGIEGLVLPSKLLYTHNESRTYRHKMGKDPLTGKNGPLMSMIAYGSGDAVTEEGLEDVIVGARETKNFSLSEIAQDNLQMLHTAKGISGILGLQHMMNRSMGESIFSKMRDSKMLSAFGYCRGANNTGTFIWGDDSTEGDKIPVIGQMHWAVTLQEVKVQVDADAKSSLIAKSAGKPPEWHRAAVRTGKQHHGNSHTHSHGQKHVMHGWPFGGPHGIDGAGGAPRGIGGGSQQGDDRMGMGGDDTGGSRGDSGVGDDADSSDPFDMGGDGNGGDDAGGDGAGGDGAGSGPFGGGQDQGDFGMDSDDADSLGNAQHDIEVSAKHMCSEWNCTAILDTGSNILAGPTKAIKGMTAKLNVKNDCSNFDQLPPITLKLGGKPVTIHAASYVMKVELPPGMAGILGGDGDGDGDGDGMQGDGDSDDHNGDSGAGGSDGDGDTGGEGGGMGGGSGGCGGGGCFDGADGEMGGYEVGSSERMGMRTPHAPAPAAPHTLHIGIPGVGGRPGINIDINRHDPSKYGPESNIRGQPTSLVEKLVKRNARQGATTARWRAALAHLKKSRGIDLSTALRDLLTYANGTEAQYLCMPALVPIDKHTPFGPLWIVGTPFLDEYYGRYSFDYNADSPTFSFISLNKSKTCQNLQHNQSSPLDSSSSALEHKRDSTSSGSVSSHHRMMRAEQGTVSRQENQHHQHQTRFVNTGPVVRKLDEIIYPHWANSLLRI